MSATIAQESARLSSIPAKPLPASRRTWRAHDEPVHEQVAFGEARGRWVLVAAVLGSGVALLDSTVVNNALPTLGRDLGADFAALQWTVNDYTLTLAALILLAARSPTATGDGRSSWWRAVASLLCGLAPGVPKLIAARMLQGDDAMRALGTLSSL